MGSRDPGSRRVSASHERGLQSEPRDRTERDRVGRRVLELVEGSGTVVRVDVDAQRAQDRELPADAADVERVGDVVDAVGERHSDARADVEAGTDEDHPDRRQGLVGVASETVVGVLEVDLEAEDPARDVLVRDQVGESLVLDVPEAVVGEVVDRLPEVCAQAEAVIRRHGGRGQRGDECDQERAKEKAMHGSLRRGRDRGRGSASRRKSSSPLVAGLAAAVLLTPFAVRAQEAPSRAAVVRPETAPRGVAVVPSEFLRTWDPITIFFPRDEGPEGGGPVLDPVEAGLEPSHPGAWTWLDARTLRFQPADPWPPLARFRVRAGDVEHPLRTLMATPRDTLPRRGAGGLDPVESITLTYDEPLDVAGLARATTLELRPLPGIGGESSRTLDLQDFEIKTLERARPEDPAVYVLGLHRPIPWGTQVRVRMRLTPDETSVAGEEVLSFATAPPFRPVAFGCRSARFPVSPGGASYTGEQALRCDDESPAVVVDLSAEPAEVDPIRVRNLVRLEPSVPGLTVHAAGRRIELRGSFDRETRYRVALDPAGTELVDGRGRPLELSGRNELVLWFPARPPWLRWSRADGVVERFGPQTVPVEGRGDERVDVRVHRVDPLDASFWPFPESPIEVDEEERPPGPGEEPKGREHPVEFESPDRLAERIRVLGSPAAQKLVSLPLRREGAAATFGFDVAPLFENVSGERRAGTYLVGMRRLDGSSTRSWMRVQVTDLALTTFEEPTRVVFLATSLDSGRVVPRAEVRVEGTFQSGRTRSWTTFFRGTTGADGRVAWDAPGGNSQRQVRRIVVTAGDDVRVYEVDPAPEGYRDGTWSETWETWLQWTQSDLHWRQQPPQFLAHLFTERPVYRPEEPVHLKAFLRSRYEGTFQPIRVPVFATIRGPGEVEWRRELVPTEEGTVYWKFDETDVPTGVYTASLDLPSEGVLAEVSFRKEAYRLPRFEVRLDGPPRAPLDGEFAIDLLATYYAGGRVTERPVRWRVTQFPHRWTPQGRDGFFFSSDARFSGDEPFRSTGLRETTDATDADGGARLVLDPSIEPTAQPRIYVVEATVTGADDQTVTSTRRVVSVPPFVLGLKTERYLRAADVLRPEVLVLGPDDAPLEGQEVTVRLIRRQWHSVLRASDFTDGEARYVTDVVDETLLERKVTSAADPTSLELPLSGNGVYLVELESHDRLGRAQVVRVDVFVDGADAVAWERPKAGVFEVSTDRATYRPGETARFVLQSPFQSADAVAVVETGGVYRYEPVPVRGGKATFELPVDGRWSPRIPVHFLLRRGRIDGTAPRPGSSTDLGKPATLAATRWLEVESVDQSMHVSLSHPDRALPGREVEMEIRLTDPDGAPISGEVTLWLVDRAVLALGTEQRLDPLPDFLRPIESLLQIRDTRADVFGRIPFAESVGGGLGADGGLLDRQTVRENFDPVPFYDPRILVGADGVVRVPVRLSDDLTTFAIRAKAVSGQRFGHATSRIDVRLPVIVQPALPRFVRPGDRFTASAVGRVVEGDGGPGRAEARFVGLETDASTDLDLDWTAATPARFGIPVRVPTPEVGDDGRPVGAEVEVAFAVERSADGAGDAFSVKLPIRDDRRPRRRSEIRVLDPGAELEIPDLGEIPRPGTASTSILLAERPAIVKLAGGLDFLLRYPWGCTEQRLATARAQVALRRFRDALAIDADDAAIEEAVRMALEAVALAETDDGLVAYWPGGGGSVSLTAWTVEWLVEAREAGFAFDEEMFSRLVTRLRRSLRSDSRDMVDSRSYAEQVWALRALAAAGSFDEAYGAEMARRAGVLDLESTAGVLVAWDRAGLAETPTLQGLLDRIWDGIAIRSHQGREIFGGFSNPGEALPATHRVLPSESRTLAEAVRAVRRFDAADDRFDVLVDGLVALGDGDGWGSTNANAAAVLALAETLGEGGATTPQRTVEIGLGTGPEAPWTVGGGTPAIRVGSASVDAGRVRLGADAPAPVAVRVDRSWTPAAPGSEAEAVREGFVVERSWRRIGATARAVELDTAGSVIGLAVGDVLEERIRVVNPRLQHHVIVVAPLAAGMEALNPALDTAPPEATPDGRATLEPTWVAVEDDRVLWAFDEMPEGTWDLPFRVRASIEGRFVQPPALAEAMYDASRFGRSPGAWVEVTGGEDGAAGEGGGASR